MTACDLTLNNARLTALPSGALWWSQRGVLCVSDLHFGKSDRIARNRGTLLPPYETRDTLERLEADILRHNPQMVICLGDSFDDLAAFEEMHHTDHLWLISLMAGRRWIWIAGNHDPGPVDMGGSQLNALRLSPLLFRHMARPGETAEVSGHYHPKARLKTKTRSLSRACFLLDQDRLIMPAFGTYTGGLWSDNKALTSLMKADATAILTGRTMVRMPMPR